MSTQYTRLLHFYQNFEKFYTHQFAPFLSRTGLSIREAHILLFLANNPDYDTARDITVFRGISKSQVSQAVELLTAEGFLLRTPDETDRRVVHLTISPEGWPLAKECQAIQEHCGEQLLAGLTPKQITLLKSLLETVLDNGARLAEEASL